MVKLLSISGHAKNRKNEPYPNIFGCCRKCSGVNSFFRLSVIYFTINISARIEKVKSGLGFFAFSQPFKANFFYIFHMNILLIRFLPCFDVNVYFSQPIESFLTNFKRIVAQKKTEKVALGIEINNFSLLMTTYSGAGDILTFFLFYTG